MDINYWMFLVGLLGLLGHIFGKFAKWETEKRPVSIKLYWEESKWRTLVALILTIGTIIIWNQLGQLDWGTAFLSGYFCDSALRTATKAIGWDITQT